MDERTAEALEASIKHWEENREVSNPKQAHISGEYCALCDLYISAHCKGCPVANRTGRKGCSGSPYTYVYSRHRDWTNSPDDPDRKEAWQKACDEQIAFLKSLREDAQ